MVREPQGTDQSFSLGPNEGPTIFTNYLHENHQRRRSGSETGEPSTLQSKNEAESRRGISETLAGRVGSAFQERHGDGTESAVFSFDEGRVLKEIKRSGVNRYQRVREMHIR